MHLHNETSEEILMLPFRFYLQEFRSRIFYLLFSWGLSVGCLFFYSHEFFFLFNKLCIHFSEDTPLVFTEISEVFVSVFLGALGGGVFFVFPWALYQIWCFLAPSLEFSERIRLQWIFVSFLVWVYGIAWGVVQVFFPFFFDFFVGFGQDYVQSQLRIHSLVSFFFEILKLSYLFFSFPGILHLLLLTELLSIDQVFRGRRSFYFLGLLVTAFLSPPDFLSQMCFFFLWICVFELSLWFHLLKKHLRSS